MAAASTTVRNTARPVTLPKAGLHALELQLLKRHVGLAEAYVFLPDATPDARHGDARISALKVDRLAAVYGREYVIDAVAERVGIEARAATVAPQRVGARIGARRELARQADRVRARNQTAVATADGMGDRAADGDGRHAGEAAIQPHAATRNLPVPVQSSLVLNVPPVPGAGND